MAGRGGRCVTVLGSFTQATVADCVTAYLVDWANELKLIEGFPQLRAYLARMYARPTTPQRIAEAFAAIRAA